jgi:hypothetical protein
MKCCRSLTHCALALSLGLTALPTPAADDCDVPIEHWQPRDAVMRMAAQQGWHVERLKIDDGCYEIRGTDAEGRRFKAKIDPATLKPVKMKVREHEGDRQRDADRDDARLRRRGTTPTDAQQLPDVTPSGDKSLPGPGATPRGRIE